jgi:hypothetical protein
MSDKLKIRNEIIEVNDYVKIRVSPERFWCKIIGIKGTRITAEVENHLIETGKHGYKRGDIVGFDVKKILDHAKKN